MSNPLLTDPGLPVPNPTKSYWQTPPHQTLSNIQSPHLPSSRDIVILGSGITGCSVARELLQADPSCQVTILEAREVCSGATGRNGGRINCVAVLDYAKYCDYFGPTMAEAIVRFELAHYDAIMAVAQELGAEVLDRSEIRPVETVAAVFREEDLQRLKVQLGRFEDAFPDWKGKWMEYHLPTAKGALIGTAGTAWPYRLITSIYTHLLTTYKHRFSIETHTPALSITRTHPPTQGSPYYSIRTPRGTIHAKHLVHCTEGHLSHHLPGLRGILVPRRGQISVQRPGSRFPYTTGDKSWSFYFRSGFDYASQNARTGDIVIGGGELGGIDGTPEIYGIAADDEEALAQKSHLAGVLPVVFGEGNWGVERPGLATMKASWTGILCASLDHVPMVGSTHLLSFLPSPYPYNMDLTVPEPEHYVLPPTDHVPNSPMPILIYRNILPSPRTETTVQTFIEKHGWSRKVGTSMILLICKTILSGSSKVFMGVGALDGDPDDQKRPGLVLTLNEGDVIVHPAGTAHSNLSAEGDYRYLSFFPEGSPHWISFNGDTPVDLEAVRAQTMAVPMPQDPVTGGKGYLGSLWNGPRESYFAEARKGS
ncbi:hypothetical protein FE257_004795 [Aspergillus nanangensis]|uniref:FAD dependent oxidoreductase domain-containing protein n=1 Tax=Aspergillus nanangensis TaxID=2582783 RepID=A0AAD4CRH5_ASPNN|nr:hypothetical protein FE257_004795 [Aspergillus nanangensis]